MWHNLATVLIIVSILGFHSISNSRPLRVSASLGLGSTTSSNEVTESEGPMAQIYTFELIMDTKNVFGVEHYRSFDFSSLATSIAFSGLTYRWYMNNVPGSYSNLQNMPADSFQVRDLALYFGGAFGIAQSSFPPNKAGKTASAAGLYLDPKVGIEVGLSPSTGFRSEFNFLTTIVGSGTLSGMSLSAGIYYLF